MSRREKVTRIIDGDTFLTGSRKRPVRLAGVYAPEKDTRSGTRATRALRNLIGGETVTVDTVARDRYGRAVANVRVGRRSVNKAMRGRFGKG